MLDIWRSLIADLSQAGRISSPLTPPPPEEAARADAWSDYWRAEKAGKNPFVPKVSFLVPVHGTEDVLPRCLRSIQMQTLREFECIVVDDESPGDVAAIVHDTVGDDPRFRVIRHEKNRGLYQARSTAADAASGLFFANIDSDDYIHERFAEILFREAVTTGSDLVECRAIELAEDGRPIRFNGRMNVGPADGAQASAAYFNGNLRNVVWNKLYARELWWASRDHNAIDVGLTVTEDTLRNTFLFPRCQRYSAVDDCLYFYCRRGSSVVKGGDVWRLLVKLNDISNSYTLSRDHVRNTGLGDRALDRLEARRSEDVLWYTREFLARYSVHEVRRELLSEPGNVHDGMLTLLHAVSQFDELQQELAHRRDAWRWELQRANHLQQELDSLQNHLKEAGTP